MTRNSVVNYGKWYYAVFFEIFILMHVHGHAAVPHFTTNNSKGNISSVLELSSINKNLIQSYKLSKNQKHPSILDNPQFCGEKEDRRFEILVK